MKLFLKILTLLFISSNIVSAENLPTDWQLGFQEPATDLMADVINFHTYILLPIITAISVFVLGLLLYIYYRFNIRNITSA